MIPFATLPWFELARFKRSRLTRAAILAVIMVPLFYGAMYTWANINPTGNINHVRAAVVNQDQMIQVKGRDGKQEPIAVGRLLAANLIGDDSDHNYDWVLTDARDAASGLRDGHYKAVLTIPPNLSKAATSTGGDPADAVQGQLKLRTNDAVNFINGQIAHTILTAAKAALNEQVTTTYLDNVYLSFGDLKSSLGEAADGAGQLASGVTELRDGATKLADGTGQLADANGQLADGARQLDDGAGQLADGLGTLRSRTADLPGQSKKLAQGARQVADGAGQLSTQVQGVSKEILSATDQAESGLAILKRDLEQVLTLCQDNAVSPNDCNLIKRALERTAEANGFVLDAKAKTIELRDGTALLADGADQVADGNEVLAKSVPQLTDAIKSAERGSQRLADGTSRLADGASQAADGARQAADGAGQLADGTNQLNSGAHRLANELRAGADQVPSYTADERDNLAKTAATPITEAVDRLNQVKHYGEALAPYFISLALWVGAMAIFLLLRPLSARAIASTTGSIRTALAGYVPGLTISVIQVATLLLVLEAVVGIEPANRWMLAVVALATGAAFTAINQMFVALFGGAGRFAALVFVSLQLTAAAGTYPIETSPAFFGFLHPLLPMTYAVHGMRAALAGGSTGVTSDVLVLIAFTAAALAVTVIAARRQQTITMKRLHPTLVV